MIATLPLVSGLAPLVCGLLLGLTGAAKLLGRRTAQLAAGTVLVRVLGDGRRATLALRTVGGSELVLAAALLTVPATTAPGPAPALPGLATAALGLGFTAYLTYAGATAPESSCGCSARAEGPIGVRSFTRAGLVVVGGLAAAGADTAWWSTLTGRPAASAVLLLAAAALLLSVSSDVDHLWLVPLRRAGLRLFGNPLPAAAGERVPVDATVQLLERSLAWETTRPAVRSALLDHWDDDGWRVLRYSGTYPDARGSRPVSVLFALDITADIVTAPNPAVRVCLVDEETEEILPPEALAPLPHRTPLPLAD
ncbi:MauE/DoxX family redox-associated membrane protein [Streptomyces sp. NPDC002514]|uniref:MauE/DoxX family redox-associated membrane protein n=1 Tax=Streptomyces sp. NPDC001270 TaxID=3364554 RepID=UPI0036B8847A